MSVKTSETGQVFYDRFDRTDLCTGDWVVMSQSDFRADDGVPVLGANGLTLAPPARNPDTQEPAFTKAEAGPTGHVKFLAVSTQTFSTADRPLHLTYRAAARTFGTATHPFGADADADDDLRLAAAVVNVLDFSTGMIFDFWLTERTIVPFYERIWTPEHPSHHRAFSSVAPAVPREPDAFHDLTVSLSEGTAAWLVDGVEVARVDELGVPDDRWTRLLGHPGAPETAEVHQVQLGFGLFTLLDATRGDTSPGLVDLGVPYEPKPSFHGGPHVWGQGAELRLAHVGVALG